VGSPSIWPGPECSKTRDLQPGDRVVLLAFKSPTRGLTMYPPMRIDVGKVATVTSLALPGFEPNGCVEVKAPGMMPWWWPACALADARSLGIAMALEAARARKWRFLLWLHEHGRHGPASRAARHLSPEAAAVDDVGRGSTWPFYLTPKWSAIAWEATAYERKLHIHDLLASPEWASLPWQRESEGVSRG
jgi:hypothetical protein